VPLSGVCVNCTPSCSSCQQSSINCTACSTNYTYAPSLFKCYLLCPSTLYLDSQAGVCLAACPNATYTTFNPNTSVTTCNACPSYCTACLSATQCTICLSGTYFYSGLCYQACPPVVPFAFNYVCQSCNVVDCQTCNLAACDACVSGRYLIGSSLCIAGCSATQAYNPANKSCDTVANSGGSILTSSTGGREIGFIPLPFFIVLTVASVFVCILHFKDKLAAVPTLFALSGVLLTLSNLVLIAVGLLTHSFNSSLASAGFYCLIGGQLLVFSGAIVAIVLWYRRLKCEKYAVVLGSLLNYSVFALLTANISNYNSYFEEEHQPFWRKYRLLAKDTLIFLGLFIIGGVLECFGVQDKFSYSFYAGVEISLLAFAVLVLQILWIWLPLKEPFRESISEKSTDNLMGSSEVDRESEH
jgi:hypothetical protein